MMPGRIEDLRIVREDDDLLVTFVLETGESLQFRGRDVYDPPVPFDDTLSVFGFLMAQATPADLVYRELGALDPEWEAKAEARRKARPYEQARQEEEVSRRARLRAEFRDRRP